MKKLYLISVCLMLPAWTAIAQEPRTDMVAVSADIVEIKGSIQTMKGFAWDNIFKFEESTIPGIFKLGEFERKTSLYTSLALMEQEGKAQILSNPKVIVKSGMQAKFAVGGEIPVPYSNNQGVGADFKKFGVIWNVLPVILQEKKDTVDVQMQIEVSNPDYSRQVTVGNTAIPSMVTRQIETEVEIKSGETLVIGGLKTSSRSVAIRRTPVLSRLPLIGALFTNTYIDEEQTSLFLFVTFDIIK